MKVLFLMASFALISCESPTEDETRADLPGSYTDNRISEIDGYALSNDEVALTHRVLYSCANNTCYYDFYNLVQNYGLWPSDWIWK